MWGKRSKNYLGLFLKEEEGIALVLYEEGGKIMVQEKEHFHYSSGWEHVVQDIDEVLFRFEQKLNLSLDHTIFFVYSHFVDEKTGDIKKPYILKIKEIVKNLELKALGYIECSEAVLHFFEKKEEMPLTAILVELDVTNVGIFVYKGGKMSYRKIVSRTNNLIDDLLTAFDEQKGKFLLPARIILYNSKDLDDESTKIVTHRWSEDYFIQLPRVEVLKEDETIEGLLSVFQEQLLKEGGKAEIHGPEKKEVLGFVIGGEIDQIPAKNPFRVHFPKIKIPKFNISKRLSIIIGVIFIALSLVLNELFLHKATLTVFFPSEAISKKLTIDADTLVSTSSATFSESKQSTGKKDIGERAKGTVTISNFNDNEKTFPKGTILETSGLQFNLDEEIKVASSSLAADGSAKLPGKKNGTVTAVQIGPESNLEKGKRFTIDNLSSSLYFAINDAVFSGGTRRTAKTVSADDIEKLEETVMTKAKNPSKESSVIKNEVVIPQLSKIELRDMLYSKEVGEEADSLTLKTTADTIYFYLKRNEFLQTIIKELSPDVKEGYSLEKERINYRIDDATKKIDGVSLNITVNTKAIKQVSKDDLIKNITGKSRISVESVLKKQYQADGFELSIKEPLPFLNSFTPFVRGNITVVISSL